MISTRVILYKEDQVYPLGTGPDLGRPTITSLVSVLRKIFPHFPFSFPLWFGWTLVLKHTRLRNLKLIIFNWNFLDHNMTSLGYKSMMSNKVQVNERYNFPSLRWVKTIESPVCRCWIKNGRKGRLVRSVFMNYLWWLGTVTIV